MPAARCSCADNISFDCRVTVVVNKNLVISGTGDFEGETLQLNEATLEIAASATASVQSVGDPFSSFTISTSGKSLATGATLINYGTFSFGLGVSKPSSSVVCAYTHTTCRSSLIID
jgi:hypothetical protein